MDMSLIAGMPEVIAYIRSQDERIEALKDEACDYESMRKHRDTLLEESEERFMEIVKLKEQLNHYQDACEEINTICGCDPCDPAVNSVSDLKQEMKRQIFKELEDELEKINQSSD